MAIQSVRNKSLVGEADTTNYAIGAKGDLLVGTADDTLTNLGIGSDGEVLIADSGETSGVRWGTAAAAGKIIQVVRATDSTRRTTTSLSYVDASLSVTITPTNSANDILLLWFFNGRTDTSGVFLLTQITDNSNNAISGAEGTATGANAVQGMQTPGALVAWDSPATTSATTYKARYKASSAGTVEIMNNQSTGQLYAIEVA